MHGARCAPATVVFHDMSIFFTPRAFHSYEFSNPQSPVQSSDTCDPRRVASPSRIDRVNQSR